MKVDLSIIIPTKNRAHLLAESITKYIKQLGFLQNVSYEIILVNDNSADTTAAVITRLCEQYPLVKSYALPSSDGPGYARQYGLLHASGNWIWYLDDDDEIRLDDETKIQFFDHLHDPDLNVIAHSLKQTYRDQDPLKKKKKILLNVLEFREKQEVFNYFFKTDFLKNNCIKFSRGLHEDIRYVVEAIAYAENILVGEVALHKKIPHPDSITFKFNTERISGYLNSFLESMEVLEKNTLEFHLQYKKDVVFTQYLGVILYLINRSDQVAGIDLIDFLIVELKKKDLLTITPQKFTEKNTNFKYACTEFVKNVNAGSDSQTIYTILKSIFSSFLSCKDLNSSLFLGPDEIRACCKRFFVNGLQKGDVVLLAAQSDTSYEDINDKKSDLISRMNQDNAEECSGCPYIRRYAKEVDIFKVDYLSLENFSYCNMKCSYCSPKYYGGQESSYSATSIVNSLIEKGHLAEHCHVVWGGGEPTLSPHFAGVNEILANNENVSKIRILSNSLKPSTSLSKILTNKKTHLVTSIDAGTAGTFKKVRGKGDIDVVFSNLKNYSKVVDRKEKITIKYIFTHDNYSSTEIISFVDLISTNDLRSAIFQISCDFRLSHLDMHIIKGIYELSSRLLSIGARIVFFDDLIRDRLKLDKNISDEIYNYLESVEVSTDFLLTYRSNKTVVLWGTGDQTRWILNNATFYQTNRKLFVSDEQALIEIKRQLSPLEKMVIVPAGVQSTYEIMENILSSKFREELGCFIFA